MIGNNTERKRYLNTFIQKQAEDIKKVDIDIFNEGSKKENYSIYQIEEITKGSPVSIYNQNGLSVQFKMSLDEDIEYVWVDREKHVLPVKYKTVTTWDNKIDGFRNVKPGEYIEVTAMIPPDLSKEPVGANSPSRELLYTVKDDAGNIILVRNGLIDNGGRRFRICYNGFADAVPLSGYLDINTKKEQIIKTKNHTAEIKFWVEVSIRTEDGWTDWMSTPVSPEFISNGFAKKTIVCEEGDTPDLVLLNLNFDDPKAHTLIVHLATGEDIIYQFYIKETVKERTVGLDIPTLYYRDALLNVTKLWLLSSKWDRIRQPNWAGFFDDRCQRFPMTDEGKERLKTELKQAIEDKIEDVIITDVYAEPNLEDRGWEVGVTSIDAETRIMVNDAKAAGATVNYTIESQGRLR